MKRYLFCAAAAMLFGSSTAHAQPAGPSAYALPAFQTEDSGIQQVAERRPAKRKRFNRSGDRSFKASGGGGVKDTCNQSTPTLGGHCDPEVLTKACDKAGGGMSTEPGGGVTCEMH